MGTITGSKQETVTREGGYDDWTIKEVREEGIRIARKFAEKLVENGQFGDGGRVLESSEESVAGVWTISESRLTLCLVRTRVADDESDIEPDGNVPEEHVRQAALEEAKRYLTAEGLKLDIQVDLIRLVLIRPGYARVAHRTNISRATYRRELED